jgi:hypothetical protein
MSMRRNARVARRVARNRQQNIYSLYYVDKLLYLYVQPHVYRRLSQSYSHIL